MFGFINIYKPKGKTSHDVVAILRRIIGIKQIGHTGTLDPFAEGVLPICIGKATRLIEFLDDNKAYIGTIKLGAKTTTYDVDGEITGTSDRRVSVYDIEDVLTDFQGEIEQTPPIYSAIKVNGKKLYEYARNGQEIKIQPRKVKIDEIKLLNFDAENMLLELFISCSKGTYIRSIANDLGEKLKVFGYLTRLVRVKAGDFDIKGSIPLENITTKELVEKNLKQPLELLNYPRYELNPEEMQKVIHGMSFKPDSSRIESTVDSQIIMLTNKNQLIAVSLYESGYIKCKKVLV